jgi:hypothetical protein
MYLFTLIIGCLHLPSSTKYGRYSCGHRSSKYSEKGARFTVDVLRRLLSAIDHSSHNITREFSFFLHVFIGDLLAHPLDWITLAEDRPFAVDGNRPITSLREWPAAVEELVPRI